MRVSIGAYEQSLRDRAIAARKRMEKGLVGKTTPNLTIRSIVLVANTAKPVVEAAEREVIPVRALEVTGANPFEWKHIIQEVCDKHGVTFAEAISARREQRFVWARNEAYYRLATELGMSLPKIGHRLGGRDHTSVLHGLRRFEERMKAEAAEALSSAPLGFPRFQHYPQGA